MENNEMMIPAAFAIAIANFGGTFTGLLVEKSLKQWQTEKVVGSFVKILKPFSLLLQSTIGYASYLVWQDGFGFSGDAQLPLLIYILLLFMNWTYRITLFEIKSFRCAILAKHLQILLSILTGILFYKINVYAGLIFIPYAVWGCITLYLVKTKYKY